MFFPIKDYNPTNRPAIVTIILILINVGVFLFQTISNEFDVNIVRGAFVPWEISHMKSVQEITREDVYTLVSVTYREKPEVLRHLLEAYQFRDIIPAVSVFSSMFMHGGWMHLLGNMLFLWIFGNNIEDYLGHFKFIVFYLICGVGAAAAHFFFNYNSLEPVIGASGAISGIMGAYLILFPRAKIKTLVFILFFITFMDIPAAAFLVIWFLFQFTYAGAGSYVAWLAHVGGFLVGFSIIWRLKKRKPAAQLITGYHDHDPYDRYR